MSGDHADERSEALQTDFFREQRSGLPSLLDKNAIESMPVPPTLLIDSGGSSVVATDVVSVDWWAEDGAGVVNVSEFDASPAGNTPSVGYDGRARLQLGAAVLPSRLHFLGFSEVGPDGAPSAPPVVELECHYLEDTECLLPRLSDSGSVEIEVSAGAPVPLKLLVVQVAWYTSSSVGIPQVQATWAIPVS